MEAGTGLLGFSACASKSGRSIHVSHYDLPLRVQDHPEDVLWPQRPFSGSTFTSKTILRRYLEIYGTQLCVVTCWIDMGPMRSSMGHFSRGKPCVWPSVPFFYGSTAWRFLLRHGGMRMRCLLLLAHQRRPSSHGTRQAKHLEFPHRPGRLFSAGPTQQEQIETYHKFKANCRKPCPMSHTE